MNISALFFWGALASYCGFEKGRYSSYVTSIAPRALGVLCLASCIVFYLTYPYPLYDFYGKIKLLATNAPFVFYYLISFFLFSLFLLSRIIRQKSCLQIPKQIVHLVMFSLFSSVITFIAILSKNHNDFHLRYAISIFSWAIIVGIVLVSYFLKNKFYYISRAFAVILISSIAIHAFKLVEKNGFYRDFYPDYIACIDDSLKKSHLVYGIAQYWDAKHIQAFSKQKVVLAQHWADLQEYKHITSDAFFKWAYDFAIISEYAGQGYTLSQKKLFAINGKPQKIIHCGNRTLLVYGKDRLRVQSKDKKVTSMQIQALAKK